MTRLRLPALRSAFALLLLASLAAPARHALARPRAKKAAHAAEPANDETQPRPLDTCAAELYKRHKSKKARALKKAYDLLQQKKYAQARKQAAPVQGDPLFQDYSLWISASANFGDAQQAYKARKFADAAALAQKAATEELLIEAKDPYSPLIRNIPKEVSLDELLAGDALASSKKWAQAAPMLERAFQRLANANAMGLIRPETLQHYSQSCKKLHGTLCDAWIQRFSLYYPKNSEEMKTIAQAFPDALNSARVSHSVGKLTQSYKAPDLDQSAFESAMAQFLGEKYGDSIKSFRQFLDDYPKSAYRYRARYWLAQAMSHQQDHESAQKMYEGLQHDSPLTYYGLLASMATGKNLDTFIDGSMPMAVETDPYLQPQEVLRLKRAQQFIAEGAFELGAHELREFRSRDALSSPFLAYLAFLNSEARTYSTAFSILGELIQRNYEGSQSSSFLRMIFPVEYLETIQKYATQYGVDPILVLSLVKQESAFDTSAMSGSGAMGLMQLMPFTAADTDPSVNRADLIEAETNIRVGTKYLKQLLTRFNGNIVLALAGYNAGPNAADRWIKENGKKGMLEFIESIPYKETREYVSSIIRNYFWYSRKLNHEGPRSLSYFWNVYGPPESPVKIPDGIPPETQPAQQQQSKGAQSPVTATGT